MQCQHWLAPLPSGQKPGFSNHQGDSREKLPQSFLSCHRASSQSVGGSVNPPLNVGVLRAKALSFLKLRGQVRYRYEDIQAFEEKSTRNSTSEAVAS